MKALRDLWRSDRFASTDYLSALAEIERLFDAAPNTPEGDMESRGLTRADLEPYIGSRERAAEMLNRKRPLSLNMIRRLCTGLGIPAEMRVRPRVVAESKPVCALRE